MLRFLARIQARILEWVALPFSRGSSQPRNCPSFPAGHREQSSVLFQNSTGGLTPFSTHSGDLPDPGIEPKSPASPALASGFFTTRTTLEAHFIYSSVYILILNLAGPTSLTMVGPQRSNVVGPRFPCEIDTRAIESLTVCPSPGKFKSGERRQVNRLMM